MDRESLLRASSRRWIRDDWPCRARLPCCVKAPALIELAADLTVQLPHRPPFAQCFGFVERPGRSIPDRQEPHICRPWKRKARSERLEVRDNRGSVGRCPRVTGFSRRRLENLPG